MGSVINEGKSQEVTSFPNHSYMINFNFFIKMLKETKKNLCPLLQRKMVFCVEVCFPSKPVFYLQKY